MNQGLIQILGIREFTDKKTGELRKYDAFFDKNWRAPTVTDLFKNLDQYVSQIPEKERWNMYYTALNCGAGKREWLYQGVLPFDVDNIDVDRRDEYHAHVLGILGLQREEVGIVFSGNGLQYIIGIKERITDEKYFEEKRRHYKAICAKLNHALALAGLPGTLDPSVFSPARLLRLPGTSNRKPHRPERLAELIQGDVRPSDFDLVKLSGLPDVADGDQIPPKVLQKYYGKPDTAAVLEGCSFLVHAKADADKLKEPEWYAALSVLGHLEDGNKLAHEFSQGHKGYSHAETEEKLAQALAASGPRTCTNIDSIWGKCATCPNYKLVTSPISIKGPGYIKTAETGFHDVSFDIKTGALKGKPRPNYEDLRRHFEKEKPYKVLDGSKQVYFWNGKLYEEIQDAYLENFAQVNFDPTADTHMRNEFKNLVQVTNLEPMAWWESTVSRRVNFQNGTLDLGTTELQVHSAERGFRYVLGYSYDKTATCPTWEKFLHDVTCGDRTLALVLMEFVGYALSNDSCWAQKALVLDGHGENGKSTFMDIVRLLAGKDNYASLTLSDLRAEGNRQMLDGKLFNMAEETPSRSLMESSIFKNLVSGGETQVRQLYKKPYVMRNRAKLVFACNELPGSTDTTHGFFRRLLIVPFKAVFSDALGNRDPFIAEKLARELPGIFNLAMQGYQRLLKNRKFTASETSDRAKAQYQREQDTVLAWLEENATLHPLGKEEKFAALQSLYAAYAGDCDSKGLERTKLNAIAFGKKLSHLIPDYKDRMIPKKIDGKSIRVLASTTRIDGAKF